MRPHSDVSREGWGRGGRGFLPHFGIPMEAQNREKLHKVSSGASLFPHHRTRHEKRRLVDPPDNRLGKAPVQAGAPFSLFHLSTKRVPKRPPKHLIFAPRGSKNHTLALFCTLLFSDRFLEPGPDPCRGHGGVLSSTNRPWPLTPINIDMCFHLSSSFL